MGKINIELAEKVFIKVFDNENLTLMDLNDLGITQDFLFDYGLPIKDTYQPFEYRRILHWQNAVLKIDILILKHGCFCEFIEILEIGDRLYFASTPIQNVNSKSLVYFIMAGHNQHITVDDMSYISVDSADIFFDPSEIEDYLKSIKKQSKPYKTYIIFEENTGYYKIGKSINPKLREATLQSQTPNIKMVLICDENVEKELHSEYGIYHVRGEWYNLPSNELLEIIDKYKFYKVD